MINKHYMLAFALFSAFNIIADDCATEEDVNRKPTPVSYHLSQTGSIATASNTASVSEGGTGDSSFTAYALIAGGTTSTSALQSLGTGEDGQILASNGSAALPTYQTLTANVRVFTTAGAGTYTPTSGTQYIVVEAIAGGGGSGGVGATVLVQSAGGGSGSYSRKVLTAGQIGAAIAYSVGTGGSAGATNGAGGTGFVTTFGGTLVTANGGVGSAAGTTAPAAGGAGGALGTGGVFAGQIGQSSATGALNAISSGAGANAPAGFGQGGYALPQITAGLIGIAGQGYGSGASGSAAGSSSPAAFTGAAGAGGAIIITEYILA